MQKEFDTLFGEVIVTLNLSNMSKEAQDIIISDLGKNMFEEVIVSALEVMSESDREEFLKLEESNDPILISEFLSSKIPNFSDFARERARSVVDDFLKAFEVK